VDRVKSGVPPDVASESLHVFAETFQEWMQRGERQRKLTPCRRLYTETRAAVAFAKASVITAARMAVDKKTGKDGRIALQMLEQLMTEYERTESFYSHLQKMMRDAPALRGDHRAIPLDESDGDLEVPPFLKTAKVVRHPVPREDQPVSVDNSEIA